MARTIKPTQIHRARWLGRLDALGEGVPFSRRAARLCFVIAESTMIAMRERLCQSSWSIVRGLDCTTLGFKSGGAPPHSKTWPGYQTHYSLALWSAAVLRRFPT